MLIGVKINPYKMEDPGSSETANFYRSAYRHTKIIVCYVNLKSYVIAMFTSPSVIGFISLMVYLKMPYQLQCAGIIQSV
jgi:hypothetical protein